MPQVSMSEFAAFLEVEPKTVTYWASMGLPMLPSGRGGGRRGLNSRAGVDWLIAREVAKHAAPDDGESFQAAKIRKMRADADAAEIDAAVARGDMVSLAEVEQAIERAFVLCATQLDGLGGRLAGQLAGINDAATIRQTLLDEARRIREAMRLEFEDRATVGDDGEGDQTPADEDPGPVGGPVEDSPARKRRARPVAKRANAVHDPDNADLL